MAAYVQNTHVESFLKGRDDHTVYLYIILQLFPPPAFIFCLLMLLNQYIFAHDGTLKVTSAFYLSI